MKKRIAKKINATQAWYSLQQVNKARRILKLSQLTTYDLLGFPDCIFYSSIEVLNEKVKESKRFIKMRKRSYNYFRGLAGNYNGLFWSKK